MDPIISQLPYAKFDEFRLCLDYGIMYQSDMTKSVKYEEDYFQKYVGYENTDISKKLNSFRTSITAKYCSSILDIGVGSGEFIRQSSLITYGYDINPVAIRMLKEQNKYLDPVDINKAPHKIEGVSLWDTLEHIPNPSGLLNNFVDQYLFISIPIFTDLLQVKRSKHYRPNEHYYYFTTQGLISFMDMHDYSLVELSLGESEAGREDIQTFVFSKNHLWPTSDF